MTHVLHPHHHGIAHAAPRDASLAPFDAASASRPMRIAHQGGNHHAALRAALAADVDWLEVDVWWHGGRIVARHDPVVWKTPVTYNRWRVGLAPRRPITLDHLLDTVAGTPVRLLLDLKAPAAGCQPRLWRRCNDARALGRGRYAARIGDIDAAQALEPAVQAFFSLGREEHLPIYLRRLNEGTAPR
ncbi:MAG: hypothetical protein U0531_19560 [Dehalococcoidia bacterium]